MGTILDPIPSTAFSDNTARSGRFVSPLLFTTQNHIPESGMWFDLFNASLTTIFIIRTLRCLN